MTQQNVRQSQSFFNDFNVREATLRAGDGILVKIVFFTENIKLPTNGRVNHTHYFHNQFSDKPVYRVDRED